MQGEVCVLQRYNLNDKKKTLDGFPHWYILDSRNFIKKSGILIRQPLPFRPWFCIYHWFLNSWNSLHRNIVMKLSLIAKWYLKMAKKRKDFISGSKLTKNSAQFSLRLIIGYYPSITEYSTRNFLPIKLLMNFLQSEFSTIFLSHQSSIHCIAYPLLTLQIIS